MQLKKGFRLWWLIVPAVALDQLTKHLARGLDRVKTVIPGILSWELAHNRGAAFSMLSGRGWLLAGLTAVLLAVLAVYQLRHGDNARTERIGLWLIMGGGLGNLIDRTLFGSVTDFIRLDFVRFAIFNAADIFICAGAFLVVLSVLISETGRKKHG